MSCATVSLTAPIRRRRKTSAAPDRVGRAMRAWATAIAALDAAATACDVLMEEMSGTMPDECPNAEDLLQVAWHASYFIRSQLSLIESDAPHEVRSLVRAAS